MIARKVPEITIKVIGKCVKIQTTTSKLKKITSRTMEILNATNLWISPILEVQIQDLFQTVKIENLSSFPLTQVLVEIKAQIKTRRIMSFTKISLDRVLLMK